MAMAASTLARLLLGDRVLVQGGPLPLLLAEVGAGLDEGGEFETMNLWKQFVLNGSATSGCSTTVYNMYSVQIKFHAQRFSECGVNFTQPDRLPEQVQ